MLYILKDKLPVHIIDHCINPFLSPTKDQCKVQMDKVINDINQISSKIKKFPDIFLNTYWRMTVDNYFLETFKFEEYFNIKMSKQLQYNLFFHFKDPMPWYSLQINIKEKNYF